MADIYPPPCIHGDGKTLCDECQANYDEDPSAYIEFGEHPAGIENWKREEELLLRDAEASQCRPLHEIDPTIPF